jgi:Holliday junction resolvase RusA-like endonuclease
MTAATTIAFRILGEAASKANSRKPATVGPADNRRMLFIKSDKARSYEADALRQIPVWARQRLEGPIWIKLRIFYASERPDLDESIVLDVLQDRYKKMGDKRVLIQAGVYRNDRQIRGKLVLHGIDKSNPRTEVWVEPLQAQAVDMFAAPIGTMLKPLLQTAVEDEGLPF